MHLHASSQADPCSDYCPRRRKSWSRNIRNPKDAVVSNGREPWSADRLRMRHSPPVEFIGLREGPHVFIGIVPLCSMVLEMVDRWPDNTFLTASN